MTVLACSAPGRGRPAAVVREAVPQEWPAVGELTRTAYAEAGLGDESYLEHLRDATDRGRRARLLVATDDEATLLGTVTVARQGTPYADIAGDGETEFRMLAVARSAQRRGIASLLVRACAKIGRQAGDTQLVCSVEATNHAGLALYDRLGFGRAPDRDWCPVPDIQLLVLTRRVGDRDE